MDLMDLAQLYHSVILAIGDDTGASDALLHVHAGLAIMLIARLITRKSLATPIPFLVVCVAELFNEVMDRLATGSWRPVDTSLDVINTLFWPFMLMIGLRIRRAREIKRREPVADEAAS